MSQWTSEYAILRDLSAVQGRVPVAVEGTLRAGDKPPSLNITEETEEEFFDHCSGDGDIVTAPDYTLIKQMLDMVRDINVSSDDEDNSNKVAVITKLNPECAEYVPTNNANIPVPSSAPKKPKKRQRNIAVESILQAIAENKQNEHLDVKLGPVRLLKPNDFISNNLPDKGVPEKVSDDDPNTGNVAAIPTSSDSISQEVVEKVNGWLQTQSPVKEPITQKKKTHRKVNLEATNMFKKKNIEKVTKVETPSQSPPLETNGVYKPSTLANEYYQKYVERSKLKNAVKEDIWSRAEKRMKEIEENMQLEEALSQVLPSSTSSQDSGADNDNGKPAKDIMDIPRMDVVGLPKHRHQLTGECVVCQVMTKYTMASK